MDTPATVNVNSRELETPPAGQGSVIGVQKVPKSKGLGGRACEICCENARSAVAIHFLEGVQTLIDVLSGNVPEGTALAFVPPPVGPVVFPKPPVIRQVPPNTSPPTGAIIIVGGALAAEIAGQILIIATLTAVQATVNRLAETAEDAFSCHNCITQKLWSQKHPQKKLTLAIRRRL